MNKHKKIFWVIIILCILIRLINIQMPLLEGAATRQAANAMVATSFYEERYNIFFPRIHVNGLTPYYYALEIHFIPFIVASFYKICGDIYPVFFRLISILFTALSMGMLYRLVAAFLNRSSALLAILFFGLSPISIYLGRSAHYEMANIFFNIATLYFFYHWTITEKFKFSLFANFCFLFSVLLKIPNLYLLLPISFLLYSKWGVRGFAKNWLMYVVFGVILGAQGWQGHLRSAGTHPDWQVFSLAYNFERIVLMLSSHWFYEKIYQDALHYALTPLGFIFFLFGFFLKKRTVLENLFYYWFLAVSIFVLLMPEAFGVHSYYHIHYLPIAAFFVAKGAFYFKEKGDIYFLKSKTVGIIFVLIFVLLSARYTIPFYWVPESKKYVLETAKQIKKYVPKEALVISSVDSPMTLLFYAHRKGWPMDFSEEVDRSVTILEDLMGKKAEYFVSADKKALQSENPTFVHYVQAHYKTIFENDFCWIVDLK